MQSEAAYSSLLPPERHIHGFLAPHSKHKSGIGPEVVFNTADGLLAGGALDRRCHPDDLLLRVLYSPVKQLVVVVVGGYVADQTVGGHAGTDAGSARPVRALPVFNG